MENQIVAENQTNSLNFKKSSIVKAIAIIQLIAFVLGAIFLLSAQFLPDYSIVIAGWLYVIGGNVFGIGPIMSIASLFILLTKNKQIYRIASIILIMCLAWNIISVIKSYIFISKYR